MYCFSSNWQNSSKHLYQLATVSQELTKQMARDLDIVPKAFNDRKGVLAVYDDDATFEKTIKQAEKDGNLLDFKTKVLLDNNVIKFEPTLLPFEVTTIGALVSPVDMALNGRRFKDSIIRYITSHGVKVHYGTLCKGLNIDTKAGRILSAQTDQGDFVANKYILCTGAYTQRFLKSQKVHAKLGLLPLKWYSMTVQLSGLSPSSSKEGSSLVVPRRPLLLSSSSTVVIPQESELIMMSGYRFIGLNPNFEIASMRALVKTFQKLFPSVPNDHIRQNGKARIHFSSITADGLPIVGIVPGFNNLYVNCGEGFAPWSLAPGMSKLCSNLVTDNSNQTTIEEWPFRAGRFGWFKTNK